jgi:hypothetical protein
VDPASLADNDVIPVPKLVTEDEFKAMAPGAERARVKEDEDLAELLAVLKVLGACPTLRGSGSQPSATIRGSSWGTAALMLGN